jgi:DnaJ-class molecular chaperone
MAKTVIIQCTMCMGTGEITERDHYRGRYFTFNRECMVCRGIGERVVTCEPETEPETERAA